MAGTGYSELNIGGTKVFFDPDTFAFSTQSLTQITPSLSGAIFFHYLDTTAIDAPPSVSQTLSISGSCDTETTVLALAGLLATKKPFDISFSEGAMTGPPGIGPTVAKGQFVMLSFSCSPMKPGFPMIEVGAPALQPGAIPPVVVRFTYSMTLGRIATT